MLNYVTHLECSVLSENYSTDQILSLFKASRSLLVLYELDGMRNEAMTHHIATLITNCFWRYTPILQVTKPDQPR